MLDFGPWHHIYDDLTDPEQLGELAQIGHPEMKELAIELLKEPTQETRAKLFDVLVETDRQVYRRAFKNVLNPYR